MFDFDPRDRDEDVRDVEMPWIERRDEPGRDREPDDARDRSAVRDRDRDTRERDHDPRDVFLEGLELPRGLEREIVIDGDRRYELNGDDSRSLGAVGAFRVVAERDLRDRRDESAKTREPDLRHLRDEGLVRFVALDGRERTLTLTTRGHHLLEAHRRDRDGTREQAFYAGVSRPRELSHDVQLYRAYLREEERLRDQGAEIRRVVLEGELKRECQAWLQERNRGRVPFRERPSLADVTEGMTSRAQELLREALTLPIAERADVAAELLASLDAAETDNPAEVEAAWVSEIERRARRVIAGESVW